jgi:hypothetical protein
MSEYGDYAVEYADGQGTDAVAEPDDQVVAASGQQGEMTTELGVAVAELVGEKLEGQSTMEDWA